MSQISTGEEAGERARLDTRELKPPVSEPCLCARSASAGLLVVARRRCNESRLSTSCTWKRGGRDCCYLLLVNAAVNLQQRKSLPGPRVFVLAGSSCCFTLKSFAVMSATVAGSTAVLRSKTPHINRTLSLYSHSFSFTVYWCRT